MYVTALYDEVWPACQRTVSVNECDRKQAVRYNHWLCGLLETALDGSKQMTVNKMAGTTTNHHVVSSDRISEEWTGEHVRSSCGLI